MRTLLTIVLVIVAALTIIVVTGSRRQKRELSADVDRLLRAGASLIPQTSFEGIDRLPAPVARYLRSAIPQPQPIRFVRLRQIGMLRTNIHSQRWMPFEAEHIAAPQAVAFLWNARVTIAPLLHVRVRDALIDGHGLGKVTLLSAFTVSADARSAEMTSGSLHRFLAEAVWYPTALLPSSKLRWSAIDGSNALATLTDHGVSVSLEFRFAETGEVTGIYTPARWSAFEGGYRQLPWEGHFRNYQVRDGMLVPGEGDVGWYIDDEWQPVWRATITSFAAEPRQTDGGHGLESQ
jgi:hypothetical protein